MLRKSLLIVIAMCLAAPSFAKPQGSQRSTKSHRLLKGRANNDVRDAQLKLELLRRLKQVANLRGQGGKPPIKWDSLSEEVKESLRKMQAQDTDLRKQLLDAIKKNNKGGGQGKVQIPQAAEDKPRSQPDEPPQYPQPDQERGSERQRDLTRPNNVPRGSFSSGDGSSIRRPGQNRNRPGNLSQPGTSQRPDNSSRPDGSNRSYDTEPIDRPNRDARDIEDGGTQSGNPQWLRDHINRTRGSQEPANPSGSQSGRSTGRQQEPASKPPFDLSDPAMRPWIESMVRQQLKQLPPQDRETVMRGFNSLSGSDLESARQQIQSMSQAERDSLMQDFQGITQSVGRGNASQRILDEDRFDPNDYLNRLNELARQDQRNQSRDSFPTEGSDHTGPALNGSEERAPSLKDLWKQAGREMNNLESEPSRGRTRGRENSQQGNGSQGKSDGMWSSISGAFSSAAERTAEGMFREGKSIFKKKKNGGSSNRQPRTPSSRWGGGDTSTIPSSGGMLDPVKKWFSPSDRSSGGSSFSPSTPSMDLSMPSTEGTGSAILPILVVLALVAGAWMFLKTRTLQQPIENEYAVRPTPMPRTINSRQDIIDAFHSIAAASPEVRGNWWTHSKVGRALSRIMPKRNTAIEDLISAYETARYLPPDEQLTAAELQAARNAIHKCSHMGTAAIPAQQGA